MKRFIETCVARPVLVTTLSLALFAIGALAFTHSPTEGGAAPRVVLVTRLPGASPEEVETRVTQKIAGAVSALAGVNVLRAQSSASVSRVGLQLASADGALQAVRERLDSLRSQLPADSEPPRFERMEEEEEAAPVMSIAVRAQGRDIRSITDHASRVLREGLLNVRGVAHVEILGGRARQLNVRLQPLHMHALGLGASEIAAALNDQTLARSVGHLNGRPLRLHGRFTRIEEVQQAVLKHDAGRLVRLADVAAVEEGLAGMQSAAVWNGQRSVLLNVRKRAGADSVAVVDAVQARLEVLRRELPLGFSVDVVRDAASELRAGARVSIGKLALGCGFAALVVWMFLGSFRGAFIAALVVPVYSLGAFALLGDAASLALALALCGVMLVLDNISRHVDDLGVEPARAAALGTREMLVPVLALAAAVAALAYSAGAAHAWVACPLIAGASLWVSFSLTPMLAARWLRSRSRGLYARRSPRAYLDLLTWCLQRRWLVALTVLAAWFAAGPQLEKLERGLLPSAEHARLDVRVHLPEGRSAAATELEAERIARAIRALPEVTDTLLTVADDAQNLARIAVMLAPSSHQTAVQAAIRTQILSKLPSHVRASLGEEGAIGSAPEPDMYVDRERAAALGVHLADVVQALQLLGSGQKVSTYTHAGHFYDVHMRVDPEPLRMEEALRLLTLPSRTRGAVTLAEVVRRDLRATISQTQAAQTAPVAESLLMGLVLLYVLLAVLLESWWQPLTTLLSVLAVVPFAILSVRLFDLTHVWLLLGFATATALVQLVRIRQLRAQGVPRLGAILQGNVDALRPVLMLTLASIACTLPWLAADSLLLLTPLITLLTTPVLYTYLDDLRFGTAPAPQPVIETAPLGAE